MSTDLTETPGPTLDEPPVPDGYELIDGDLVERSMGAKSSWVGGRAYRLLEDYCESRQAGWALPADTGYRCFPQRPKLVRKPDASFIRRGRLPGEDLPDGEIRLVPDLAVEVVSPNDLVYELDEKLDDYSAVGVKLVWVINPRFRTALVYRADGTVARLREPAALDGEDVLPGFRCPLAAILPPVPAGAPPA